MKSLNPVIRLLSVSTIALTMFACSDGSDTARQAGDPGTGSVSLLLTDKPADPDDFLSVNATIEMVTLIGDDDSDDDDSDDDSDSSDDSDDSDNPDGGHVVIYDGPSTVIDLLRLRHDSIPLSYADDIPAGEYCKIRLTLSDLELVLADDTPDDPTDNETFHPKLPGNGKIDIKVRDCIELNDGDDITLEIDIDAGKSIHIVGNGKGYNFRPVIFVNKVDDDYKPRLVRLDGIFTEHDDDSLLLCDAVPVHNDDSDACAEIHLNDDTALFDNIDQDGAAVPLAELFDDSLLGETISVVGWPRRGDDDHDDDDHVMELNALVIQLGDFLQLEGNAASDADSNSFSMDLADGSPISTDSPLLVALQADGIDYKGTRIVSKSGDLLDSSDIVIPLALKVIGVLEVLSGSDDMLKAALIIVDMDSMDDSSQVSGIVTEVLGEDFRIDPDEDTVCGVTTDDLLVIQDDDADILTVTITDDDSSITAGGDIMLDAEVGLNGECDDNGFEADSIVIVNDLRS